MASDVQTAAPKSFLWAAAFVIAFIAMGLALNQIRPPMWLQLPLMLLPMLLMIPYLRAYERRARMRGSLSTALIRYNRRFGWWSVAYVVLLFLAIYANKASHPLGLLAWPVAILPALAVLGMVWTMARYILEEDDEYLRQRQIMAGLIATGITLSTATIWGFFELFQLVPHIQMFWIFPLWAIGLGLGQMVLKVRGA